jgi:hypothetical protein
LKPFAVVALACALCASPSFAADPDYSTVPLDRLIDDLALIDSAVPGVTSKATYESFIAVDERPVFTGGVLGIQKPEGGVLGVQAPDVPPQMRELARRGIHALLILIQHLDDARPTKLSIGGTIFDGGFFTFQLFADEYDPRNRPASAMRGSVLTPMKRSFQGKYVVKFGDICYALIGQIVNRELLAARYQPSAGLVVNSPIETPSLIDRIKKDWGDLDARAHEKSLLDDVRASDQIHFFSSALKRLRFYYPSAYAALQGDDAKKRALFEAQEASRRAPK